MPSRPPVNKLAPGTAKPIRVLNKSHMPPPIVLVPKAVGAFCVAPKEGIPVVIPSANKPVKSSSSFFKSGRIPVAPKCLHSMNPVDRLEKIQEDMVDLFLLDLYSYFQEKSFRT